MGITVVGLGPSDLSFLGQRQRDVLMQPDVRVIVRTLLHPAAREIEVLRPVETCDDLYENLESFDDVYESIVRRIADAAAVSDVVYAVPGSASVGERAVSTLRQVAAERGIEFIVLPGMSFLDLAYAACSVDPIADGVQILDARALPDPLPLHVPTFITQVDSLLRASDVSLALGRTLDSDHAITVLDRLGDDDEVIEHVTVGSLTAYGASERTTVFVDAAPSGLLGLIATNRILRSECPWDKKQTHHTLLTHLIEEAYETADAIGHLPIDAPGGETDFGAYAEVEEELGDLLLQVVFHATLAAETGAFDVDEVAEGIRRKLVARHPHVFGDVTVDNADEVLANWEQIKQDEKQRQSLMDDVPLGMSGVARAMKVQKRARSVGFDWKDGADVFGVLKAEIAELEAAEGPEDALHEIGDVLFTAINLSRHMGIDPETALRTSVDRFMSRFRSMERAFAVEGSAMADASPEEFDAAWHSAKAESSEAS
jgi:tetrapyrrole methylase family protein/MazG family protein